VDDQDVFSLIGEDGFRRLVAAFYRQVPQDALLGPMYAGSNLAGAEDRLREFLIYRFGGPPRYIEQRGHPRLRMRHLPFRIGTAERDAWMLCMAGALAEVVGSNRLREYLLQSMSKIADWMRNDGVER